MEIDWITVSAQIVNFLLLVYLLQHFLYQPVVKAMDRREQRITDRLREARERESEAGETVSAYERKKDELREQRESLMDEYRKEARDEKQQLLEQAREEVQETRRQWQRQIEREKDDFLEALREQIEGVVADVARKALTDLADEKLESRIIEVFIRRLKELDQESRQVLAATEGKLVVTTGYELDDDGRARLKRAIGEYIGGDVEVGFEVSPEPGCGLRLGDDEHSVEWNLDDYMNQVTGRMERVIEDAVRQG